jgi:hypothetical protein
MEDESETEMVADPESEHTFDALAKRIAWEMSARLAIGDRVDSPNGISGLAELIADAVLDEFVVRVRTNDTPRYRAIPWRPCPR